MYTLKVSTKILQIAPSADTELSLQYYSAVTECHVSTPFMKTENNEVTFNCCELNVYDSSNYAQHVLTITVVERRTNLLTTEIKKLGSSICPLPRLKNTVETLSLPLFQNCQRIAVIKIALLIE